MTSRRAKTLDTNSLNRVLEYVEQTSANPLRDTLVILLSFKAGLRVGEIAGLRWKDVCDAWKQVRADAIEIPANIAKKGSGRTVPLHPALHAALVAQFTLAKPQMSDPVVPSLRNHRDNVCPNSLQRYLSRLYQKIGLVGVTSHSGRRSFLTRAARLANTHGCSLKDVQLLAGHRYIDTTENYIDPSDAIADLVRAV